MTIDHRAEPWLSYLDDKSKDEGLASIAVEVAEENRGQRRRRERCPDTAWRLSASAAIATGRSASTTARFAGGPRWMMAASTHPRAAILWVLDRSG